MISILSLGWRTTQIPEPRVPVWVSLPAAGAPDGGPDPRPEGVKIDRFLTIFHEKSRKSVDFDPRNLLSKTDFLRKIRKENALGRAYRKKRLKIVIFSLFSGFRPGGLKTRFLTIFDENRRFSAFFGRLQRARIPTPAP